MTPEEAARLHIEHCPYRHDTWFFPEESFPEEADEIDEWWDLIDQFVSPLPLAEP